MKNLFLSGITCLVMCATVNASNAKKELTKVDVVNIFLGDCKYQIFEFDRDGNYTGKFVEATVQTNTASDCLEYVIGIAAGMQQQNPDYSFRIFNDFN